MALSFSVNLWHRVSVEALAQLISLDEDDLRLLLDEIPVGIAIAEPVQPDGTIRPDARINFCNKKWTEMFGFDADDVETVAQATHRLYPDPEVHARMMRMRDEAAGRIREGGRSEQTEIRAMGANGEWLDLITGTTVVGDRLVVTMLDITERKRTARQLEEAQRSLENSAFEVTKNIPAGTYTMVQPPEGGFARFRFLSSRFLEMCGLTREACEQDPLNVFALVHPEDYDEFLRKNIETLERKVAFREEFRVIIRGETRWFHAASNPRPLPGGSTVWEGVLTDITERKLAEGKLAKSEQHLRRSEQKYRNFFNLPLVGTAITSRSKGWIDVNDQTCEILGYPREELFQKTWADITHPDDLAADEAQFARMLRREIDGYELEKRFIRKDGTVVYTLLAGGCGPIRDKIPDTFYVNILDITARKKAEDKLRDALMNLPIPVAVGTNDEPPRIALVNRAFTETFGYTHEEIPTVQRWIELAYPDPAYRAEVMARWEKSLHNDPEASSSDTANDVRIRCKDGSVRDAIFSTTLTPDGPIVTFQDITERKRAEAKDRESAERMRLAASAAGLGFWSRDSVTGLEEWDDEMLRLYGVRREDFHGKWEPFVHPDDATGIERLTREAEMSGRVGEYEYRIIRPDGTVRHVRGCSTFVPGPDGRLREIGVNYDITAQKEATERERRLQAEHRRELENKLKTSLSAAAVAHEINQPLSAILLDSQMALERLQGDSPEFAHARNFLCSTIGHAARAVRTIDQMSSLLRSVQSAPREVDLRDVVRSAGLYAKDALRVGKIELRIDAGASAMNISGDEGQLLLAVSNLLRNAIESIEADDCQRPRRILVSLRHGEHSIVLAVGDSGAGLPEKTLAKIPLHTTKPEGTGLGLFIVKSVADNHGATLEAARSELGGAEMRLVFPTAK